MSQSILDELMSKLEFNPDSKIASLIRREVKKGKFPEKINLGDLKIRCKIYGGLISLPVELGGKKIKHVWINDVIFRYLPYSIRTVRGKRCIVKGIKLVNRKPKAIIMEDLKKSGLIEDNLKNKVHKTTSYVKTHVTAIGELSGGPYQTITVEYEPQYVNYVARKEKEVYDEKSGRFLRVPVYYIIGRYEVQEDLRKALRGRSRDFTRGFRLKLRAPSEIINVLHYLSLETGKAGETNIDLLWSLIKVSMDEYVHLAVHLILNQVVKEERWNPRDIDHYVDTAIDLDEELKQRLKKILIKPLDENEKRKRLLESLLPRISITVVVGSKADLLEGFDWSKIRLDNVEKLSNTDLEAEVIFPRCPVKPDFVRDDPIASKIIIGLSKLLLEELKNAASKVKAY